MGFDPMWFEGAALLPVPAPEPVAPDEEPPPSERRPIETPVPRGVRFHATGLPLQVLEKYRGQRVTPGDVVQAMNASPFLASKSLTRLVSAGLATKVRFGVYEVLP